MNESLYIIRGTGLVIDGTIVIVVENVGDYSVVSQPNLPNPVTNIMVKTKCLQPIGDASPITYSIEIKKHSEYKPMEATTLEIDYAFRDVGLDVLVEFIDKTISPILRME